MNTIIQPFHLLVIPLAGWLNRDQQALIDYRFAENPVLKEQVAGQRLRFTDERRIRLAIKAKVVGRRLLDEIETLVTPDTLLAWHRKLIANKWIFTRKSRARPRVTQDIVDCVRNETATFLANGGHQWLFDIKQGADSRLLFSSVPLLHPGGDDGVNVKGCVLMGRPCTFCYDLRHE